MAQLRSDQELLAAAADGHEESLAEVYDRYSHYVYGIAAHILGPGPAAEDVVQEVFLRVWRNAHRFDGDRSRLSTWLLHIARNAAVDSLRSTRGQRRTPDAYDDMRHLADTAPTIEAQVELSLFGEQVREAMLRLSPDQRLALEMAYFGGFSHQEIADQLHQPLGTVKSRIRLALENLRAGLSATRRKGVRQGEQ